MERERVGQDERTLSGVARSQNSVYVLPNDAASIGQFLDPALERASGTDGGTQLLVVTDDADTAVAIARAADARTASSPRILPITSTKRGARLLAAGAPPAVAGAPGSLLELVRSAALKLEAVRVLVIAWADTLLEAGQETALESLLAEVPKDAARVIVTSRATPQVEQLIERYARRARRVGDAAPGEPLPVELRYVATAPGARSAALRRLLDDIDPGAAAVYARSEHARDEVATLLRTLGLSRGDPVVQLTSGEPTAAEVLVLLELPGSRAELRRLLGDGRPSVIALVQPRQLGALRLLAAGAAVSPLSLSGPASRARSAEDVVRQELRAVLADGVPSRELLALEPLLDEHDGIEIAAAALRLLERSRERGARAEAAAPSPSAMTAITARIYINAGSRDKVGPGDLVGAISGESGIPGSRIGRIDLRDNHAIVEVRSEDAERIVQAISGIAIRGRRIVARLETERPAREPRSGASADRGERSGRPSPGRKGRPPGGRSAGGRESRGEGRGRPPRDRDRGGRRPRDS